MYSFVKCCSSVLEMQLRKLPSDDSVMNRFIIPKMNRAAFVLGRWLLGGYCFCKSSFVRVSCQSNLFRGSSKSYFWNTNRRAAFIRRTISLTPINMAAYREEPTNFIVKNRSRFLKHFSDTRDASLATNIDVVLKEELEKYLETQSSSLRAWLHSNSFVPFKGKETNWIAVPSVNFPGKIEKLVVVLGDGTSFGGCRWMGFACLSNAAPAGLYKMGFVSEKVIEQGFTSTRAAFAWALGAYSFPIYKGASAVKNNAVVSESTLDPAFLPVLIWPDDCDRKLVESCASATFLVRDMISTPAEDMGPSAVENIARLLAEEYPGATVRSVIDEALIKENFPQIYMVGRGASNKNRARMIELVAGDPNQPTVCLLGKGVSFDSGGLDIKSASGMRLMKKDMGGAAHAFGLASMILSSKLPIHLRVIISAVENAVDGESYRPGDIIKARNGLTTEVCNTDAEGRLILADALVYGCEFSPELIVDFATLTGAARVALGTDVAVFFSNNDRTAEKLGEAAVQVDDPVWRLPLYSGYRAQLDSKLADLKNIGEGSAGGYGGAILAALYLKEFVTCSVPWIHFDIMAYNLASKPGKPEGGEAMGMRAVFRLLQDKYGNPSHLGMI
ncbi:Probable cytosol aminopeptidase [Galdieria sulphuraria]|nr:Probable cytosol aminopeptidase [Galdieria sulphuraria]